jgi:hypothetical protein
VDASDVVQDALLTASRRLADYLENPAFHFMPGCGNSRAIASLMSIGGN